MEMIFANVGLALVFLSKENSPLQVALGKLLAEHALPDAEVKITDVAGEITGMTFDSGENLSEVISVGDDWVISIHSGEENSAWANVFPSCASHWLWSH